METLNNNTNKFTQTLIDVNSIPKKKNYIMDSFLEILNPPRIKKGFPLISYGRLSMLLKHLNKSDKNYFLGECKHAKNPSAFFWWSLKVKK